MLLSQGIRPIPTTPASAFPASGLLATSNNLSAVKWSARVPAAHVAFPTSTHAHDEITPVPVMSMAPRPRARTNSAHASPNTHPMVNVQRQRQNMQREHFVRPQDTLLRVQSPTRPAPPPPVQALPPIRSRALNPHARSFTPPSALGQSVLITGPRMRNAPPHPTSAAPPPPFRVRPPPVVARRAPAIPTLPAFLTNPTPATRPPTPPPAPTPAPAAVPVTAAVTAAPAAPANPQPPAAPATPKTQPLSFQAMTPEEAKAIRARILASMLLRRSLLQERPVRTRVPGIQRPYIPSRLSTSLVPVEVAA